MVANIIEDREENHQQFLIEVYLPFLVHRIQIDWLLVLHNGIGRANGSCPIYLVIARMEVAKNEEEETLVVLVELD